jgi:hypothetical protein
MTFKTEAKKEKSKKEKRIEEISEYTLLVQFSLKS